LRPTENVALELVVSGRTQLRPLFSIHHSESARGATIGGLPRRAFVAGPRRRPRVFQCAAFFVEQGARAIPERGGAQSRSNGNAKGNGRCGRCPQTLAPSPRYAACKPDDARARTAGPPTAGFYGRPDLALSAQAGRHIPALFGQRRRQRRWRRRDATALQTWHPEPEPGQW